MYNIYRLDADGLSHRIDKKFDVRVKHGGNHVMMM